MKKHISVAEDFSDVPGGRHRRSGAHSAEEFREEILVPAFQDPEVEKVEVTLDGCMGFASSFLEEAFGGLVRQIGSKIVIEKLEVVSKEQPYLLENIASYVVDAEAVERKEEKKPEAKQERSEPGTIIIMCMGSWLEPSKGMKVDHPSLSTKDEAYNWIGEQIALRAMSPDDVYVIAQGLEIVMMGERFKYSVPGEGARVIGATIVPEPDPAEFSMSVEEMEARVDEVLEKIGSGEIKVLEQEVPVYGGSFFEKIPKPRRVLRVDGTVVERGKGDVEG